MAKDGVPFLGVWPLNNIVPQLGSANREVSEGAFVV